MIYQIKSMIYSLSQFVCLLFYFEMFQNIILFLKIKIINLLMFLLYLYFIFKTTVFEKKKNLTNIFLKSNLIGAHF